MRRTTCVLGAAAGLGAALIGGGVAVTSGAQPAAAAGGRLPVNTTPVLKRTLTAMVSEAGTLTFAARADDSPYAVVSQGRGTFTHLPAIGDVIRQGQIVYRVNSRPVVLLYGSTPVYRVLSAGRAGSDVAQLNEALITLGDTTRAQLDHRPGFFGPATTAAVKKLQDSLGDPPTGALTPSRMVFEPTAVRVTSVPVTLGTHARPDQTVLLATSTRRQVQLALSASQLTGMAAGDRVTITLPDNHTTGVVSSVGTVATCPPSSGGGGPSGGPAAPGIDSCPPGGAGGASPTIPVDVRFSHPLGPGAWDQAPVQVGVTTAHVRDALSVPVTALLARASGGYAVEVIGAGARRHLVPVALGLFDDADGLVQVTASGLTAGQRVVIPST